MLKSLKIQLQKLENESNNIKVENEMLTNLVRQKLAQTERKRKKLNEMSCDLKRKIMEGSSLSARNEELLTKNTRLLEERCMFDKKIQNLDIELDKEKKQTKVMGMEVALPKEIPQDQEQLEKTIDILQKLITMLRSRHV